MKYIVLLFCLFTWAGSFAADTDNPETEQTITVCSLLTDYEPALRQCVEVMEKGEKCGKEVGYLIPQPPLVSQDVSDTIQAIYTDIHNSCDADIQCILEQVTSAKAEHCTDSD